MKRLTLMLALAFVLPACGDDDDPADALGIGAACTATSKCGDNQSCLTQFKGGYCGSVDCKSNDDCPGSSACVVHDDGKSYCFRTCTDKIQCNANRDVTVESNCVGSVTFASGKKEGKVCEPPSGS